MTEALRSWSEMQHDFDLNWFVYLSMPFVAAFVGYITKIAALVMLYHPLEYRGLGPFGWQGIVPARAGKVAATTVDLLTENLLDMQELLDAVDIDAVLASVREPLAAMTEDVARSVTDQVRPGFWDALPAAARRRVLDRAEHVTPKLLDQVLLQIRADVNRYIDLKYLTVTTLVRNKAKLNRLIQSIAGEAMGFIRRTGLYFGIGIGLLQMVAWGLLHDPWIMPVFGFAVGFISDWVALTLLFRPMRPRRILGLVRFQGVLHRDRQQITQGYAEILAADLFAPDVLIGALLDGPAADRIFTQVANEVSRAVDAELGLARPIVRLTAGDANYQRMKEVVIAQLLKRMPETMEVVGLRTFEAFDVAGIIGEKMALLTDAEFESIMRPVFKDDEPLMISVGAVLGAGVGELQVLVVEHLSRAR